ncbi:UNKNOWN [Stylonychia lemnae]|uniref:Transmembrane protein n=1 Tax=Stylonychia lemnae TaxID=5949 RepID=A0A077ZZY0_STYLE|nr:UNKNOWN [Stylonychia lemnae]|eukprot:CDW74078.1 UNKNOWN [Stylonychia lemnae]
MKSLSFSIFQLLLLGFIMLPDKVYSQSICQSDDYIGFLQGFAYGQSEKTFDVSSFQSPCYVQHTKMGVFVTDIYYAFETFTFWKMNTFFNILFTNLANIAIQQSDLNVACANDKKIKQLNQRVTTFAGFFDMISLLTFKLYFGTDITDAFNVIGNYKQKSCKSVGEKFGYLLKELIQAGAPLTIDSQVTVVYATSQVDDGISTKPPQ